MLLQNSAQLGNDTQTKEQPLTNVNPTKGGVVEASDS